MDFDWLFALPFDARDSEAQFLFRNTKTRYFQATVRFRHREFCRKSHVLIPNFFIFIELSGFRSEAGDLCLV